MLFGADEMGRRLCCSWKMPIRECRRSADQLLTNDQVLEARQLIKEVL